MKGKRKREPDDAKFQALHDQITSHHKNFDLRFTTKSQDRKRRSLYNGSGLFDENAASASGSAVSVVHREDTFGLEIVIHSEQCQLFPVSEPPVSSEHDSPTHFSSLRSVKQRVSLQSMRTAIVQHMKPENRGVTFRSVEEIKALNMVTNDRRIEHVGSSHIEPDGVTRAYLDLGDCNEVCEHCKATFWYEERLKSHFVDRKVQYHRCCNGGKVVLPVEREPSDYIKELFRNRNFLDNVRAYNQMFSMTSFGVRLDKSVSGGKAPYVFKISGQIHHLIGTLCPIEGDVPRFLQLYIYDTTNEVDNRMKHFGGEDSGKLNSEIVEGLIRFFNEHNELVKLFRTASDKCNDMDVPEFRIRLYSEARGKQYELPSFYTLGAIVFESGPNSQMEHDVIIELRDGIPHRINKLHPSYMSLQFPLLFIYGQPGYHVNMKLSNFDESPSGRNKRLTMNMYYRYQLLDRINLYGLLLRGGIKVIPTIRG